MADEIDTGVTPDTASMPDPVAQVRDQALAEMAKDESIEAYAAERQARDAEAEGEPVDDEARSTRIREALAKAIAETTEARQQNGLDQPDLDQQYQSAEQEWQQAQAAEVEQESALEQAKAEGRFTAVAEQLKAVNPQAHEQITEQPWRPRRDDATRAIRRVAPGDDQRRPERKFGSSAPADGAECSG